MTSQVIEYGLPQTIRDCLTCQSIDSFSTRPIQNFLKKENRVITVFFDNICNSYQLLKEQFDLLVEIAWNQEPSLQTQWFAGSHLSISGRHKSISLQRAERVKILIYILFCIEVHVTHHFPKLFHLVFVYPLGPADLNLFPRKKAGPLMSFKNWIGEELPNFVRIWKKVDMKERPQHVINVINSRTSDLSSNILLYKTGNSEDKNHNKGRGYWWEPFHSISVLSSRTLYVEYWSVCSIIQTKTDLKIITFYMNYVNVYNKIEKYEI